MWSDAQTETFQLLQKQFSVTKFNYPRPQNNNNNNKNLMHKDIPFWKI